MKILKPTERKFTVTYVKDQKEITSAPINFYEAQDLLIHERQSLYITDIELNKLYTESNINIAKKNDMWEKIVLSGLTITAIIMFYFIGI